MNTEAWKEEVQYIRDTPVRIVIDDTISVLKGRLMPHWHEEIEIDCVLKGVVYYTVEGVTYCLNQGDVVVVNSGAIHSGRCREGTSFEETNAEVMTIQINKNVFHYASYADPVFETYIPREHNSDLRSILMEIRTIYKQQNRYYEILLNSGVLKMCYCLLTNHTVQEKDVKSSNSANQEIKQALKYIEDHCMEKLRLEDVAGQLKYNTSYFSRRFHRYTGFTFVEYLNRCRTEAAAEMLLESDKTVAGIALDCGFPNVSSFITFFKRQYHMTPEQYRKTIRK